MDGGAGGGARGGQAAGPAAEPPTRAPPVCFDAVETACGRWGGGFWLLGEDSGGGGFGKGRDPGMVQRGGGVQGGRAAGPAAEPPTRAEPVCFDAVETACGRWRCKALPCMGKRISKTPKRPRSDVP